MRRRRFEINSNRANPSSAYPVHHDEISRPNYPIRRRAQAVAIGTFQVATATFRDSVPQMSKTHSIFIEALIQIAASNDRDQISEIARAAGRNILAGDGIAFEDSGEDRSPLMSGVVRSSGPERDATSRLPFQSGSLSCLSASETVPAVDVRLVGPGLQNAMTVPVAAEMPRNSLPPAVTQDVAHRPDPNEMNAARTLAQAASAAILRCRDLAAISETNIRLELERDEVRHRLKNAYATAIGLARLSLPTAHSAAFAGRLSTLAKVHDFLDQGCQGSCTVLLKDVLTAVLSPYQADDLSRVMVDGPDVELSASTAAAVGLFANELATNALKHGSLSVPTGVVVVQWSICEGELSLWWREIGGPTVIVPQAPSEGSKLLRAIIEGQLRGKMAQRLTPTGLYLSTIVPLD